MNKKKKSLLINLSILMLAYFYLKCNTNQNIDVNKTTKLPGALQIIDAGHYSSLQEAINAIPESGGIVQIPPGQFEIKEPLVIQKSDIHLNGSGTSTHIKNLNTVNQPAIILQHSSRENSRNAELWRIRLSNFRITGNEKSGSGIEARRINEIFIDGVTVSYHGGDGIHLYYCYEDPRISNNLITYNRRTGLHLLGCHDIIVSANQFEENNDAVFCSNSFNLCMTGNNLDDHLGNGVVIENTYGSVVSGNMIEECNGVAVIMDRDCYGNTVSANVIAHNTSGGVDLRDAHGCAVSANTFTIMGKDAVRVGPNSGRIMISGNTFSDSYVGDETLIRAPEDRNAGGLVLEGTSDVGIIGNMFSGVKPGALILEGKSKSINYSSNVIVDAKSDHIDLSESVIENNLESK